MVAIKKSKEQRRQELQYLLSLPDGMTRVYLIMVDCLGLGLPAMPPVGLPMIQTILAHEYPDQ